MEENKKINRRNNIIVITLFVLLVAVVTLFLIERKDHRTIVNQINKEKDLIESELSQMVTSYDSLSSRTDTLNQNLELAQNEVKNLLVELAQVKRASFEQVTRYRKEVTTLRKIMRNYIVQIDSLNQRNKLLMAENTRVKTEYKEVVSLKEQLEEEKKELEETVSLASTLEALNLQGTGINTKGKDQIKISKINKLKISFTLSKNLTAERGPMDLYVRIMRPDNVLLIESENNLFHFEGSRIPFSASRQVEYEGLALPVNIFWDYVDKSQLISGVYTVDVFAQGKNIGTTSFKLK